MKQDEEMVLRQNFYLFADSEWIECKKNILFQQSPALGGGVIIYPNPKASHIPHIVNLLCKMRQKISKH